jgi:hypothetical protein
MTLKKLSSCLTISKQSVDKVLESNLRAVFGASLQGPLQAKWCLAKSTKINLLTTTMLAAQLSLPSVTSGGPDSTCWTIGFLRRSVGTALVSPSLSSFTVPKGYQTSRPWVGSLPSLLARSIVRERTDTR